MISGFEFKQTSRSIEFSNLQSENFDRRGSLDLGLEFCDALRVKHKAWSQFWFASFTKGLPPQIQDFHRFYLVWKALSATFYLGREELRVISDK